MKTFKVKEEKKGDVDPKKVIYTLEETENKVITTDISIEILEGQIANAQVMVDELTEKKATLENYEL